MIVTAAGAVVTARALSPVRWVIVSEIRAASVRGG